MYQQNFPNNQNFGVQSSFGTTVPSQYRGLQKTFQPTGYVPSVYGSNQQFSSNIGQNTTSPVNTQAYHTANYRGDQPGHDTYLRADSVNPTQSGLGYGVTGGITSSGYNQPNLSSTGFTGNYSTGIGATTGYSGMGQSNFAGGMSQNQGQYTTSPVNTQAYHTTNYRGNQLGHDNYLRSDSVNTAQSQAGFGGNLSSYGTGTSSYGTGTSSYGSSNLGSTSMGSANLGTSNLGTSNLGTSNLGMNNLGTGSFNQSGIGSSFGTGVSNYNQGYSTSPVSTQSYQLSNYQGNQQGHDSYLRADSTVPSNQGFGSSFGTSFGTSTTNRF